MEAANPEAAAPQYVEAPHLPGFSRLGVPVRNGTRDGVGHAGNSRRRPGAVVLRASGRRRRPGGSGQAKSPARAIAKSPGGTWPPGARPAWRNSWACRDRCRASRPEFPNPLRHDPSTDQTGLAPLSNEPAPYRCSRQAWAHQCWNLFRLLAWSFASAPAIGAVGRTLARSSSTARTIK